MAVRESACVHMSITAEAQPGREAALDGPSNQCLRQLFKPPIVSATRWRGVTKQQGCVFYWASEGPVTGCL